MYNKKKIHIFIPEYKKKYALTPKLRFKQLACDKYWAANLFDSSNSAEYL